MIYVCGLDEMPECVRALRPGYLVSLVQSAFQPPTPAGIRADRHLRVAIDDVSAPIHGYVTPGESDVQKLIDFLRSWPGDEALLLHCYAGVSRSTAAALIALTLNADGREMEAAHALREAAPHAQPNPRIIALADRLLGREGRLVAAREAMGPAEPIFEGPLVELSLLS
jgi:predicted protein tyrosine phosphatase